MRTERWGSRPGNEGIEKCPDNSHQVFMAMAVENISKRIGPEVTSTAFRGRRRITGNNDRQGRNEGALPPCL